MWRSWIFLALMAAALLSSHGQLSAQGIFLNSSSEPVPLPRPVPWPRPGHPEIQPIASYRIKQLEIDARIRDQVASVQVTQTIVNTGNRPMEVSYCFPLPYDGAMEQMTFLVDGKEYEAKLLDAQSAREIYQAYIRKNQDPALLEWVGTGMFRTSVFPVPAGAERKVSIRFSQLLRKSDRLVDFLYPLAAAKFTSQAVESLTLRVHIECSSNLKSVYSPTHPIQVQRGDDKTATITYESKNVVPSSDFRLLFDTAPSEFGASLISYRPDEKEDGYFLLLVSPEVKADNAVLPPKTVILTLDRSGSMSGKKIQQAKQALQFVVNNLRSEDLFNILVYDSQVESFQPELQRFDEQTRKAALGFIEGIFAGGSTNISEALSRSLKLIQDSQRPSYLVFLTDGLPTAGEKNELKICAAVKQLNLHRTRIINFGVGYDVNARLLDRIARDNFGSSQFVRPEEDLEQQVAQLYQRMSRPVMSDVKLSIEVDDQGLTQAAAVNRIYPKQMLDLFAGDQMVVLGRYRAGGQATIRLTGQVAEKELRLDFPANLVSSSNDQSLAFVEKLWAMRRVGEIIDDLDLNGKNQELIDELIVLSKRHGILTPYTAFLADDTGNIRELADANQLGFKASANLDQLSVVDGQAGVAQRAGKKMLQESRIAAPGAASAFMDTSRAQAPVTPSVINAGALTLYRRGSVWYSEDVSSMDLEKDSNRIRVVERFSDEYFRIVQENNADQNAALAQQPDGQELVILLRGTVYRFR